MGEVLWVSIFGLALAWLQSQSREEVQPPPEVHVPADDEWTRWEEEIHDWRDQ
ncbi:hypothetical protein BH23ACT9_BH23ACT9_31990 [soil metagenome]